MSRYLDISKKKSPPKKTKKIMLHKYKNNLGRFISLACVWSTYPCGGNQGDFLTIGHKTYIWDKEQHNWILDTYANSDSYALLHQTGDLMLLGDLRVGGKAVVRRRAVFKDDVIIEGQLICRHTKGKDKGLFDSFDSLNAAVPCPHTGDWALVGTNATPQLWTCQQNRQWQLQGTVALSDSFNLDGYNLARDIVGDLAAMGYVFGGVADVSTNPHTPPNYNVVYLTSQPGRYTNFDNIEVKYLSALMWNHDPNMAKGGYWTAHAILGKVFVNTENIADGAVTTGKIANGAVTTEKIANGAVTLDKTAGLTNYVDEHIAMETQARASALNALSSAIARIDGQAVKSVSVNSGEKKFPDDNGNVNLVIAQGGGGGDEDLAAQVEANTSAIKANASDIKANASAIVTLQNAVEAIGAVDPLSPEAYGAVPDGIDLWNRPLRNYRGDVENVEDSGYFDVEIPLPDCYIPYPERWSQPSELTKKLVPEFLPVYGMEVEGETVEVHLNTNLIFYDTAKRLFVLNIGGSYYSSWKNSHEWNNNSLARIDCVYCRTWDRSTFLFDGNSMINIMDTDGNGTPLMTDNRAAIERCLRANKGSMRLTPGKIYFCTVDDSWERKSAANPFYNIDGFEIDGRGATLYLRSVLPGVDAYGATPSTSTFMWMYNCRNGKIKNLAIKALRDRSNLGAATNYLRYSASDSRLTAFGVHRCKNIEFENLELLNMHTDFSIKDPDNATVTPETRNNNISISRVKSRGVCVNAAAYVDNLRVDRVDVEGYPYIGGGCHLIYGQTQLQKMYISNSRFKAGIITECVLTFHGSPNGNITVENTVIDAADWIRGYNSVTHKQKYVNCEFRQTLPVQYEHSSRSISRTTKPLVLNPTAHYEFVGCRFTTKPVLTGTGYMLERAGDGSAETPSVVTFRDCVMEAVSADTVTNFFKWSGTNYLLTVDGCTFKSSRVAAKIGLTASDKIILTNNKVLLCQTIDNDYVTRLVEELTGHPAEVPKYAAVPTDAVAGDYYYDTSVNKFFKGTSVNGGAASWEQVKSLAERVAALE